MNEPYAVLLTHSECVLAKLFDKSWPLKETLEELGLEEMIVGTSNLIQHVRVLYEVLERSSVFSLHYLKEETHIYLYSHAN